MKKKLSFGKSSISKRTAALLLSLSMFSAQASQVAVIASEISGITPSGNTYNIPGEKFSGQTQFRHYDKFNLTEGDIANLIYKNGYKHFVNLVNNQININGIVNTMQNGTFYNGHAIFVSPNGMVVGASGVLNVGSLSVMTPTLAKFNEFMDGYSGDLSQLEYGSDKYNGLITDSQGNIVINGKILSREDVKLYGKNITVAKENGSNKSTGIVAGYKGTEVFDELSAAENVFNSLVSNNAINADGLALKDGKVVLVAQAKTTSDDKLLSSTEAGTSASVKVQDAFIAGSNIDISATAEETVKTTADKLTSALNPIFDNADTSIEKSLELVGNYFNGEMYEAFDGARSSAVVEIINSNIHSTGDTSITAKSSASLTVDKAGEDTEAAKGFIYALGTKTNANVNVKNSTINAGQNLDINAVTSNKSKIKFSNEDLFEIKGKIIQFMGLNHSTAADTQVIIDNSTLHAGEDVVLSAINANTSTLEITTKTPAKDENKKSGDGTDSKQAPSSVALAVLLKNEHINTNVSVKNSSSVNAGVNSDTETGHVNIVSQNLNFVSNTINTEAGLKKPKEDSGDKPKASSIKDIVSDLYKKSKGTKPDEASLKKFSEAVEKSVSKAVEKAQAQMDSASSENASKDNDGKDAASNVKNTDPEKATEEQKQARAQLGGSMIINLSNIETAASITNSTVTSPESSNVIANAIDLTVNNVFVDSTKDADYGAGLAILVNKQQNDTLANISGSSFTAGGLNVNATTELPMNSGDLKINFVIPKANVKLTLGLGLDSSGDGNWDFSLLDPYEKDADGNVKCTITNNEFADSILSNSLIADLPFSIALKSKDHTGAGFENFFNNYVKSQASGDNGGVAGSFMYNAVENNTIANIEGSTITVNNNGNVNVNAANSVVNYNAVGVIDFIENILHSDPSAEGAKFGIGGSVLVDNFDNNARAYIDNSTVTTNGDVIIGSATEQAYIAAAATGAKSEKAAIIGSVLVQSIGGETYAGVTNQSVVFGNNVEVNAGKAKIAISTKDEEDKKAGIGADGFIAMDEQRVVNDKVSNFVIGGALSQQKGKQEAGGTQTASSGVAVGASVNVNVLHRNVNAVVNDSTITANNSAKVTSDTTVQDFNTSIAGAFAGGIVTEKAKQENANKGDGKNANGAQKLGNFGGWIDKLNKLTGKGSKLDNATESKNEASKNATGSTVIDQTSSADDALNNSNSITVTEKEIVRDEKTGAPKHDENGNVIEKDVQKTYTPDENGVYRDSDGGALYEKDKDGHWVEKKVPKDSSNLATNLANKEGSLTGDNKTATTNTAKENFSLAAAGSVNVNSNTTQTKASVSNSVINVRKSLDVQSNQETKIFNLAAGGAKAGNVGAGAAINVDYTGTTTQTVLDGVTLNKLGSTNYDLNVLADEYNKLIDVAVGLGAAASKGDGSDTKVAVGGSFNVNVQDNNVTAKITNSTITDADKVLVVANNYTDTYKGAGGLGITKKGNAGVGAGIASNTNVLLKTTTAEISNSTITANDVAVGTNNKIGKNTEDLVSFAVGGAVIAGSSSGYIFTGALGTDVILNNIAAQISNSSDISASGDVNVVTNSNIHNANVNGSLSFSSASKGFGLGIGSVVSVIDNEIKSEILDSTIAKSNFVQVLADSEEKLEFLALNMGIQTGAGNPINVNGIVNVLGSSVGSYVTNSNITSDGAVSVTSDYDNINHGLTLVGTGSQSGTLNVGGNVLVNVYDNTNEAIVSAGTVIDSKGDVEVSAISSETLDMNALSVSATSSGTAALAADISANVLTNTTKANILGDITNSASVLVKAGDVSTFRQRSMTVAGSGGTAGVGGSVIVDVLAKNVEAATGSGVITSNGSVKINANSENSFGGTKSDNGTYIVTDIGTPDKIAKEIENSSLDEALSFLNWEMAVDAAGGSSAGVSGSLITKVLNNLVKAEVLGTTINAGSLDVKASDYTIANTIVGNITGAGTAAVGGSIFVNTVIGETVASITNSSTITTTDDINILANNKEDIRSIMVIGGGAGTVAVNGSASVNVISDNTTAQIDGGVIINNANNINVISNKETDIQSVDLAANGAGTVSVGGILKTNVYNNTTDALVGSDTARLIVGNNGSLTVKASADEEFSAIMAVVGGAGTAAISGIGLVNVVNSDVNAVIRNADITSENNASVSALHGYNKKSENKTAVLLNFLKDNGDNEIQVSQIEQLSPNVSVLSISGAGSAAATGSIIVNTISGDVNAGVINSAISTENGLNINAEQNITTYDAMAGIAGSGFASVVANGIVNVIDGDTNAFLSNSQVVKGGVSLDALAKNNINSIGFAAAFSGQGASVAAGVDTNVIDNTVNAYIDKYSVVFGDTSVIAQNNNELNNVYIAGTGNGMGAAVAVAPMLNAFVGSSNAYIIDSTLNDGASKVRANTGVNTGALLVGGSVNGVGAGVNGFVITNTLLTDTNAYINNSTINNPGLISVFADTDIDMYGLMASLAGNGIGAAVTYNGIVNVIDTNTNAYISNSSILSTPVHNGQINVSANLDTDLTTISGSASGNGIGAATAVNSLVNVFTNDVNAYILSAEIADSQSITVKAQSDENLNNTDIGFTASGTAGVSANALVNVFENKIHSYIDTADKNISSTGKVTVDAKDLIAIKNTSGVLAASGFAAAGASVVVNVINNEVQSQILGNTGLMSAKSAEVSSISTIGMTNLSSSAAVGLAGISGSVVVNSIGSGINISTEDSTLNKQIKDATVSANTTISKLGTNVSTTNAQKGGVLANVNAKLTTEKNIDVLASNTLKGYDTDTFTTTNAAASGGLAAVTVGVLVNDMKYKTTAQISGGEVISIENINIKASNAIKSNTNAVAATIGGIAVNGNTAYFNNQAGTNALISNATVNASSELNVLAVSDNNIIANAIAGSVGLASINLNVAIAQDSSSVNSKITGNNVQITADTLNLNTNVKSVLSSELLAADVGGATAKVVVNKAISDVLSNALVDAAGTLHIDNINIIARNNGIDVDNAFYTGTLALFSDDVNYQGAFVNTNFNAGINNSGLTVSGKGGDETYAKNIKIISGVNNDGNTGLITADVLSKKDTAGLASASTTAMNAVIDANSTATLNTNSLKTNNLTIASQLNKKATTGTTSGDIGAVSLNTLLMDSKVTGENTITINGNNQITNNAQVTLQDDSDTTTKLMSGSIKLVGSEMNIMHSTIDTDTNINLGGNLSVGNMNVKSAVTRDTYNSVESNSGGLAQVEKLKVTTKTEGDSAVNISANAIDTDYNNNLKVEATAQNTAESILSTNKIAIIGISKDTSSNTLNNSNVIRMDGANIKSKGNVSLSASSDNRATMRKTANEIGVVIATGSDLQNNITSTSNVEIKNSTISADNINIASSAKLGNVNDEEVTYDVKYTGGLIDNDTQLNNKINQSSKIDIVNSNLTAANNFNAKINTDSAFKQRIKAEGSGFSVHVNATSNLTVDNNNTFNNDANSTIRAEKFNLNLDSSNKLASSSSVQVAQFLGRDGEAYSYLNLTIDNEVNNSGTISTGTMAQIDYMTKSHNDLKQYAYMKAEAAIATGEVGGNIKYIVNNTLNVPKNALISSDKDVLLNYTNGNNNLDSDIYGVRISRIFFGIPIHSDTPHHKNIDAPINNALNLDGEIKAGHNAQRYMLIDKDGNIQKVEGFSNREYQVVDNSTISGQDKTDKTIADLKQELDLLNEKLTSLVTTKDLNDAELATYEEQLAQIQALIDGLKDKETISQADVQTAMKDNIKTAVVGSDANQITEDVFNAIYDGYSSPDENGKYVCDTMTFAEYLDSYIVEPATETTAEVKLTDAQKITFINANSAAEAKLEVVASANISTYDGKIILSENESLDTIRASLDDYKADLADKQALLENNNKLIANNIISYNDNITSLNSQIDYLKANPYEDITLGNATVMFEDLKLHPSSITLNGLKIEDIKGSGKFVTYSPSLTVENYSNKDLVFNSISLGAATDTGLIINNRNYADYAKENKIIHDNVRYVIDKSAATDNDITIKNYFDNSNPTLSTSKAIASNITINGIVKAPDDFIVWNESGDITFGNSIAAMRKDIVSTQGNVVYNNSNTNLELAANDRIFAGKNITINAKSVKNNGKITAGYDNRNLTITEDMLNNLVVDPTTGVKNMINLGESDYSAYLNNTNNIKALYIDGKIVLFNTQQSGGAVDINSNNVSGSGTVAYTNGYAHVNIVNNTNSDLIVNNLSNNYMDGTFDNHGSIAHIIKHGYDNAQTLIQSQNSTTVVNGLVQNAYKSETEKGSGKLSVIAKNIQINNRLTSTELQDYVIDATDELNLTSSDGMNINGKVVNRGGKSLITNTTTGNITLDETANIISNGEMTIENKSSGIIDTVKGSVLKANADSVKLVSANGISLGGKIENNKAFVEITNNNSNLELTQDGLITGEGTFKLTNSGNGSILAAGTINTKGTTELKNSGAGAVVITETGTVQHSDGNTRITNSGEGGLNISGTVAGENSNIEIENQKGQFLVSDTGVIKNNENTEVDKDTNQKLSVKNSSENIFSILGRIFSNKGKTEIANTNENSGIEIDVTKSEDGNEVISRSNIINDGGELKLSNAGSKGINVLGDVISNGTANIENTNGGLYVATITAGDNLHKGIINSTGILNMTNSGSEGINVTGDITNKNGKLTISNENAGIVIGRTYIDENTFVQGKVENNFSGSGESLVIKNTGDEGILVEGIVENTNSSMNILNNNTNDSAIIIGKDALILSNSGTINLANLGNNGIDLKGDINNKSGVTNISNNNTTAGIIVETTATLLNNNGNLNLNNTGKTGILIEGLVNTENKNINITNKDSNIVIGEYDSDNDFYVKADNGNIIITQTNGNVLNGIVDPDMDNKNSNHDLANPDKAYKTLLASGGNLIMNVVDGDVGVSSAERPGFSLDASSRDYTESINVSIGGTVDINAINSEKTDDRLVNLRAKDSDMNIKNITSNGNIILTAVDWKQGDEIIAPENEEYFHGYSIFSGRNDGGANITGQEISVIASDKIGTSDNRLVYNQDTAADKNAIVSFEAEGDIYLEGMANSSNPTNVNQIISKRGDVDFALSSDAQIREITANNHLHILQKGESLTIYDLGKSGTGAEFEDILFPHDRIELGTSDNPIIPQTIAIEVLDALNGGNNANSTLKIYNAYAKGANNGKGMFDKNGKQLADITLMADNIYANSASAPNSVVSTSKNPNGYTQTGTTYSNAIFGGDDTTLYATGFNSYGEGAKLSFDVVGVSKEFVDKNVKNANRTNYNVQKEIDTIDYFQNPDTLLKGHDYRADNVAISVNSNEVTTENRGVNFNKLYVNDAYIDTKDLNLTVRDAYVNNYAEIRNGNREGSGNMEGDYRWSTVIDNDFRRLVDTKDIRPVTLQLYTQKTGSFSLAMGDTIVLQTNAPIVYYNPKEIINGFDNENSFYRLTYKDDKIQETTTTPSFRDLKKRTHLPTKRVSMRFDTVNDSEIQSNFEILDISRTGALIKNDGSIKVGEVMPMNLKVGDIEANVDIKVVRAEFDTAGVEFINMPEDTINKIIYRYMKMANAMKPAVFMH